MARRRAQQQQTQPPEVEQTPEPESQQSQETEPSTEAQQGSEQETSGEQAGEITREVAEERLELGKKGVEHLKGSLATSKKRHENPEEPQQQQD